MLKTIEMKHKADNKCFLRNMCLHTIFCLTYIIHSSFSPHFYFYHLLTFILPSRQGNSKWDYKHLTCVSSSADLNDSFLSLVSFCVPLWGIWVINCKFVDDLKLFMAFFWIFLIQNFKLWNLPLSIHKNT